MATPTLLFFFSVEKIPNGRFWIGKSELFGTSTHDFNLGSFALIIFTI